MTKRSAAITELENQLRDMVGACGGLLETRWVGRFVELMRETANTEGKEYLLKVLFNTPQSEKAALSRFIQLNGVEILAGWIAQHQSSQEQDDIQIVHSCLSCLNKLTISTELLEKTKIGKVVNKLAKHSDPSIQAKANTIVSKWKKIATEQEDLKPYSKLKKETRVVLPKKYVLCRSKLPEVMENSERVEEVYIPQSPPESNETTQQYEVIESASTNKLVRYVNTLYELRLIVIDGPIKST